MVLEKSSFGNYLSNKWFGQVSAGGERWEKEYLYGFNVSPDSY